MLAAILQLGERMAGLEARMASMENRLLAVESRLGIVEGKVDRLETIVVALARKELPASDLKRLGISAPPPWGESGGSSGSMPIAAKAP